MECFAQYGDFNVVLGANEKISSLPSRIFCVDFGLAVDSANLYMLDTTSCFFTWARCGLKFFVESKLDRAFSNQACLDFWDSIACIIT